MGPLLKFILNFLRCFVRKLLKKYVKENIFLKFYPFAIVFLGNLIFKLHILAIPSTGGIVFGKWFLDFIGDSLSDSFWFFNTNSL